jgi:hypothetical protein
MASAFEVVGELIYDRETDELLKVRVSELREAFQARQYLMRDRTLRLLRDTYLNDQVPSDVSTYAIYRTVRNAVIDLAEVRLRHEYGGF